MGEQYFTKNPVSDSEIYKFDWNLGSDKFWFYTGNSVFSKKGVDFGSMLLIETVIKETKDSGFEGDILDMGCGYGPIGIMLAAKLENARVTMADINERALELAAVSVRENKTENRISIVRSSAFESIKGKFDIIVTNPPIRAGKQVVFSFYKGAAKHLNAGGRLYVVIQKKQGASSTKDKLMELFGNCETAEKKSGYFIFRATYNN